MQLYHLGVGNGTLIENTDGTVSYRATGTILPAFNVKIADVTGVTSERAGFLTVKMKILGRGTTLAEVAVNYGTTELIRDWFAARSTEQNSEPLVAKNTTPSARDTISEEIIKLKNLFDSGVLTEEEFSKAKAKILDL